MRVTKEQIKEAIDLNRKLRMKLPQRSFFGDDNWQSIDTQIQMLEAASKGIQVDRSYGEDEVDAIRDCYDWIMDPDSNDYLDGLKESTED